MHSSFDINILILMSLELMIFFILFISKPKFFKDSIYWFELLTYLFLFSMVISQFIFIYDLLSFQKFQNLYAMGFGGAYFSFLAASICEKMIDQTAKKIKTIWRLPLIGALLGYLLSREYIVIVPVVINLSLIVWFWKHKDHYPIYLKNLIWQLPFIILLIFDKGLIINNLLVIFIIFFMFRNINLLYVKTLLRLKYDEIK